MSKLDQLCSMVPLILGFHDAKKMVIAAMKLKDA